MLIPLLREEIVDIVRTISQERIKQRIVEKIADVPVLSIQTQLSNIVDVLDAIRKNLEQMQNDMFRVKTNHEDLVMKHIDDKVTGVPVVLQKEDLEADTAKHSSVLETAVSRSTLDGEVSSRDRISQHTMEQTLNVPVPEMVTQSVEVPKTISQNRIQQRTMKQIVDDPVVQIVQIPQVHVVEKTAEIPVMTQRQNHMVQTLQMPMETPQLQRVDRVIVGPVVQVEHVPQSQIAEETVEIAQLDVVEKTAETTETQTIQGTQTPESLGSARVCRVAHTRTVKVVKIETPLLAESASPMFVSTSVSEALSVVVDTPVPQAVEELVETSKVFSQNRVQQSSMGQIIANPAISLAEMTVEMPVTRTKEKAQHVVNTHVQHVINTVEAEKPIINETINQVTKHVEIPQLQIVEKTVEAAKHIQQERVKELRSKFEVGHTSEVPRPIRSVQKTVEVPRVQYIDKVADIPVDVQRRGSIIQAAQHDLQHIDDDVHVPALIQSEVPTIPDTDDLCSNETGDEDRLEQESKKRKLTMPADAVSESRADESDFGRFDDLVLPSPERKTVFISIASSDDAEDESDKEQEMTLSLVQGGESMLVDETDAQGPEHKMVQVAHTEWVQELRDVKNELMHVRELVGVLVRRERSAENKAEVAARRLDRMEREQTEADDAEHEANLQEALANQSKTVKVLVDKWFVDKGYGFILPGSKWSCLLLRIVLQDALSEVTEAEGFCR